MVQVQSISLCMIARNEEELLAQCLSSVKGLVEEIVIVDTGSSDRTVEIAQTLGAKVLYREWDDDFSAPRNLSLKEATADWILVLDADEALDAADHDKIRELTSVEGVCYLLTQRHYTNDPRLSGFRPVKGECPHWEKSYGGYFESSCVRLFPNHQGIQYKNRIHELVEPWIEEHKSHRVAMSGIRIHHYGHVRNRDRTQGKGQLYTDLGKRKLNDKPSDWKSYFELGVEHQVNRRLEESTQAFLKAVELNPKYVDAWVNMGYVLGERALYREAASALKTAIQLSPQSSEAYCNLGVVHLRTQNLEHAARCFLKAVEVNKEYVNAWCNLGETFLQMSVFDRAIAAFEKALTLVPQHAKAHEGIGTALLFLGQFDRAEHKLKQSAALDSSQARPHYWLGQISRLTGRIQEAVQCLEKFCELEGRNSGDPRLIAAVQQTNQVWKRLL